MREPDADALQIGSWVAQTALSQWFDETDPNTDFLETGLTRHVPGVFERRRLLRDFEQIADIVAAWLLNEAPHQAGLADTVLRRQLSAVADTLRDISVHRGSHLEKWRDPILLASLIPGTAHLPDPEGIVLLGSLVALREILIRLRESTDRVGMIPQNTVEISNYVLAALRAISPRELAATDGHFESRYRRSVGEKFDRVQLAGVGGRSLPDGSIMDLFVPPRVRTADRSVPFVDAVAESPRLLVQGEPGCGKTTALQWLAMGAARAQLPEPLVGLNHSIPFFVRLRAWADVVHPPVRRIVDLITAAVDCPVPSEWVQRALTTGTGWLLIDGLDELTAADRREAWEWLREMSVDFPAARMVVTTRPSALSGLPSCDDFDIVDLLPMEDSATGAFVHKWYSTAAGRHRDLSQYEESLRSAIATSPHVARLATNPLMCSLLCALNMDRHAALPTKQDIYPAVLEMLLDSSSRRMDAARLTRPQSSVLLEQIAYWFLTNQYAEADRADVLHQISRELRNMPEVPDSPERVLRSLVAPYGVLRESVPGRIDFFHQTFAEFLAARAMIDEDAVDVLVGLAHDEVWSDVAVLAAGQASDGDCIRLLTGLLRRADNEDRYRSRLFKTVQTCLRDRPDVRNSPTGSALVQAAQRSGETGHVIRGDRIDQSRGIIAIDIENFTAPGRTSAHQIAIHQALYDVLMRAFSEFGVSWESSVVEDRGDGAVVLAPPGTSTGSLGRYLPPLIVTALQEFNTTRSAEARVRLRMAFHAGRVDLTGTGIMGPALNEAFRLLDSFAVRDTLRKTPGLLAVVLSDVVHQELADVAGTYQRCTVTMKEFQADAWVGVFGVQPDVHPPESTLREVSRPTASLPELVTKAEERVASRAGKIPPDLMRDHAADAIPARDALALLRQPGIGVMAGLHARRHPDPIWMAAECERGGARAIGLDIDYQLPREMLADVRRAVGVPLLCNDLIISRYQVYEARSWGADLVLLIAAAMPSTKLTDLCELTESLGIAAVVRIGNLAEADHAVEAGAPIISIDTRDLSPNGFEHVTQDLPLGVIKLAENVRDAEHIASYDRAGANAVLIDVDLFGNNPRDTIRRFVTAGEHPWSSKQSSTRA